MNALTERATESTTSEGLAGDIVLLISAVLLPLLTAFALLNPGVA